MPTDPVLTLVQWFSPAFPVGAFHFSHGLEQAVDAGTVTDAASLGDWISDVLQYGAGRNDAVLLAASHAADGSGRSRIDDVARALAASSERLTETVETGAAFARIISQMLNRPIPPHTYPVTAGHAAAAAGLPVELTACFYLQGFVTNLATIGMRALPLGQTAGQSIIRDLTPACARLAGDCVDGNLDRLSSTAFAADIAAMRHETQYSRMFRT